jgi:hypothetical protein
MRYLQSVFVLAVAVATTGCFQMTTTVKVNGDSSGTIDQRQYITAAGMAVLGQVSMGRGGGGAFDPLSEETARGAAARLGEGVTYVSSTPIADDGGQGRAITYAFTDISQVRIGLDAPGPSLVPGQTGQGVTCTMTKLENGNALLRITVPQPFPAQGGAALPPPEQIAMIRSFVAGARVSIAVEPAGAIVSASTPYVDGNRVTLLEADIDQLLKDDVLTRIREAKTPDGLKAVLARVPGAKLNLEPTITIEFTPR